MTTKASAGRPGPEKPFVPSLVPAAPEAQLLRDLAGEAGKLLVAHPELASPRTWMPHAGYWRMQGTTATC